LIPDYILKEIKNFPEFIHSGSLGDTECSSIFETTKCSFSKLVIEKISINEKLTKPGKEKWEKWGQIYFPTK